MYSSRIRVIPFLKRQMHGNAEIIENCTEIRNRNPRNLERLRIARKPSGYHLEEPGREFWHKLVITTTNRSVGAEIHHFENGCVISCSSKEWGLRSQLYRGNDVSAYINVGRVLAERCLECGISEVYCKENDYLGQKPKLLMEEVKKCGVSLQEPPRYKHRQPWDKDVPEKPWETFE